MHRLIFLLPMLVRDYQRELDAAFADEAFVTRVRAAAAALERNGWAVIEDCVNDPALLAWAHARFWDALGQAAPAGSLFHGWTQGPPHTREQLAALRLAYDWPANKHGILEDGPLAHLDCVHALRLHPRVAAAYALLYGATSGLVAAPDRLNVQMAPELLPRARPGNDADLHRFDPLLPVSEGSWLHCDQSLAKHGRRCIQGLVVGVDADQAGDASLEVVTGSHHWHDSLEATLALDVNRPGRRDDWYKFSDADKAKLDLSGFTQVRARAGALVLWESRTMHQGGRIRAPRVKDPTRGRFVVYTCMQPVPKDGLTVAQVKRKQWIFEQARCTSHWPLRNKVFAAPRTYGRAMPVFTWPTEAPPAPGTAAEELYGLTAARTLRFVPAGTAPLLAFTPDVAVPRAKRARDE